MTRDELISEHYQMHYGSLIKFFSYRHNGNEQDAEDIVQEAYARALKYFDSYDAENSKFTTWFGKIIVNCERDLVRAKLRNGSTEEFDEELYDPVFEDHALRQDFMNLRGHIDRCKQDVREVLTLYYIYQYSLSDIASLLPMFKYKQIDNMVKDFRNKVIKKLS